MGVVTEEDRRTWHALVHGVTKGWTKPVVLNMGDNAPQGAISFFRGAVERKGAVWGRWSRKGAVGGHWSKPNL